jgi:hypothetical protein
VGEADDGQVENPPSTGSTTPLTRLARSLSRNEATAPTSAPVPALRSGVAAMRASTPPGIASRVWASIGVSVGPGAITFTRSAQDRRDEERGGDAVGV